MMKGFLSAMLAASLCAPCVPCMMDTAYAASATSADIVSTMEEIQADEGGNADVTDMNTADFERLLRRLVNATGDEKARSGDASAVFYIDEAFLANHDASTRDDAYDATMAKIETIIEDAEMGNAEKPLYDRWTLYVADENAKARSWYVGYHNAAPDTAASKVKASAVEKSWDTFFAKSTADEIASMPEKDWEDLIRWAYDDLEKYGLNPEYLSPTYFDDKDPSNINVFYVETTEQAYTALHDFIAGSKGAYTDTTKRLSLIYFANYNPKARAALLEARPGLADEMDAVTFVDIETEDAVAEEPVNDEASAEVEQTAPANDDGNAITKLLSDPVVIIAGIVILFAVAGKLLGGKKGNKKRFGKSEKAKSEAVESKDDSES